MEHGVFDFDDVLKELKHRAHDKYICDVFFYDFFYFTSVKAQMYEQKEANLPFA